MTASSGRIGKEVVARLAKDDNFIVRAAAFTPSVLFFSLGSRHSLGFIVCFMYRLSTGLYRARSLVNMLELVHLFKVLHY